MLVNEMVQLGAKRSGIRELFEYGLKKKAELGAENVYDFSIGNPSVPAPQAVQEAYKAMAAWARRNSSTALKCCQPQIYGVSGRGASPVISG